MGELSVRAGRAYDGARQRATAVVAVVGVLLPLTALPATALPVTALPPATSPPPAAVDPRIVVSITFDDAQATQYLARDLLAARGLRATFYVPSRRVGSSDYYMGWEDLQGLARDGNEIGGHTLDHADLSRLSDEQARRQVCDDRKALRERFPEVVSFAYPYAASRPSLRHVVQSCGYATARGAGSIRDDRECRQCDTAESIPPLDPFSLRTPDPVVRTTTLAQMRQRVTQAEQSGGWVVFVFHGICRDTCTAVNDVSEHDLARLLDWLAEREEQGLAVRTVGEVLGAGRASPVTELSGPCAGSLTGEGA